MVEVEEIHYESTFRLLICKLHGYGVHPFKEAIKRHLRGEGHRCRGERLKCAVATLTDLPLSTLEVLRDAYPAVDTQPVSPPISHLRVLQGWSCTPCAGQFLTTSLELMQRHAASLHGRRRGEQKLWEACELQTFFSETKDRLYFRVASPSALLVSSGEHFYGLRENNGPEISQALCEVDLSRSTATGGTNPWLLQGSRTRYFQESPNPIPLITFRHPLTYSAEKHVRLSSSRIDSLFKSIAFRNASEPLFDGSHADAALDMLTVFPCSTEEPLFLNALLYSTVQIANRGRPTIESLSLQGRTIELLNEKLKAPHQKLSPAAVGAIMILKTVAFKTGDVLAHEMHAQGLTKALEFLSTFQKSSITPAAKRATFWLDLFGSVVLGSERHMSHLDLPYSITWKRESSPKQVLSLPAGFVRLRNALPQGLLECISDAVELEECQSIGAVSYPTDHAQYHQLDTMQASIESRLALLAPACRELGVVAEAVRLGVFMVSYVSFMETWNVSLIPCRVAEQLLDTLEPTLLFDSPNFGSVWQHHVDLVFWLLLVLSSVAELDQGHVEGLKARQSRLVLSVVATQTSSSHFCLTGANDALQNALQDFVYAGGWLQRRCYFKEWFELELSISACNS